MVGRTLSFHRFSRFHNPFLSPDCLCSPWTTTSVNFRARISSALRFNMLKFRSRVRWVEEILILTEVSNLNENTIVLSQNIIMVVMLVDEEGLKSCFVVHSDALFLCVQKLCLWIWYQILHDDEDMWIEAQQTIYEANYYEFNYYNWRKVTLI